MKGFVEIPPPFLKSVATSSDRIPTLYYSNVLFVRYFFWLRLKLIMRLLSNHLKQAKSCLDFGGGGGVFLPTLSRRFSHVTVIDLETVEATKIIAEYNLKNIEKIQGDILKTDFGQRKFDVIVAADVLEHFQDLTGPTQRLKDWLAPDGLLATSLPTESGLYRFLRLVFNVEKPVDHYHNARQVERYLESAGFKPVKRLFSPFIIPLASLYSVTLWRFNRETL